MQSFIKIIIFRSKTLQLQLQSPSGNIIPPSNSGMVTQVVKVANPEKVTRLSIDVYNLFPSITICLCRNLCLRYNLCFVIIYFSS